MGNIGALSKIYNFFRYGKQIGKVSKNGAICYGKKLSNGMQYTTIDSATGQVKKVKRMYGDAKFHNYTLWDGNGNVLASGSKINTPISYGTASHNKFAHKSRIERFDYNHFGQVVNHRVVNCAPNMNKPTYEVLKNVNGNVSKTYLNTMNNSQYTITCVS